MEPQQIKGSTIPMKAGAEAEMRISGVVKAIGSFATEDLHDQAGWQPSR